MKYSFKYEKAKVIQALRYHFITRPEIKGLLIIVNIFAVLAAVLFYAKKIHPLPFLLSSFLWVMMMIVFWFALPGYIYRKAKTFKDRFIGDFEQDGITLETERGSRFWSWNEIQSFFESPNFFHIYFSPKEFFIFPKDGMSLQMQQDVGALLNSHLKNSRK